MNDEILNVQASAFNALAHPLRLKILEKLSAGPCCVCKIMPYVHGEQSNVSHHLAILRKAGIVRSDKRGHETWYEIADPAIIKVINIMLDCIIRDLDKKKDMLNVLIETKK
ncbi:hypothetical protein A2Y85_07655 [candidate division WOR-3 bacterium RBG_13_43_14]|uniref:HTH arsR-type domain-containing protein n=1 Tax=candidate division WOR-3 bacterium RBG_13_43_14 TaxID=1802590 RepID=A0A1F4UEQ3_UNCW3|nr:MAG: hypothetical protein A2Y85_07655 [candidate division WOR-3 bacterium RBG_13_43_14]